MKRISLIASILLILAFVTTSCGNANNGVPNKNAYIYEIQSETPIETVKEGVDVTKTMELRGEILQLQYEYTLYYPIGDITADSYIIIGENNHEYISANEDESKVLLFEDGTILQY